MHQDQSAKPFWIWASVQANNATTHMSIHIIIDGYNLIRNSNSLKAVDRQDMQAGRESLVDMLAMYKRVKSHRITVVFDGPTDPVHSQYRDRVKGIDIKFSSGGQSADAVIKKMASREKEKALIVSSDREIIGAAQQYNSAAISSSEFEEKLMLATYMHLKGADEESENSGWPVTTKKKGPRRRLSKQMRRNMTKIRKL
jgi:predicted RNA-binding protein with PIN domain